MGFFNKILIQETKTGNLIDITNLDRKHYECFLNAIERLNVMYKNKIKEEYVKDLTE